MAITIHTRSSTFALPADIDTLPGFRRWAGSPDCPEYGSVWFVSGNVWIDTRPLQVFSDVAVRGEIVGVLHGLTRGSSGLMLGRGAFWVHPGASVAGNPDGVFVSRDALQSGRVRLLPDPPQNCTEVEGAPEMVLEIARSNSSAIPLFEAYYEAGVSEYWLVDARGPETEFRIYKRGAKKFTATKKVDGWMKSTCFGKSFRLVPGTDDAGKPEFTLELK